MRSFGTSDEQQMRNWIINYELLFTHLTPDEYAEFERDELQRDPAGRRQPRQDRGLTDSERQWQNPDNRRNHCVYGHQNSSFLYFAVPERASGEPEFSRPCDMCDKLIVPVQGYHARCMSCSHYYCNSCCHRDDYLVRHAHEIRITHRTQYFQPAD